MNLYKDFFYTVMYGLDTLTDAKPNYLQIEIYANPDTYLNEYNVEGLSENSKEQIMLRAWAYIDLDRRKHQHWRFEAQLTENVTTYYEDLANKQKYGHLFVKKHIKTSIEDLNSILSLALRDFQNSKNNTQEMSHTLSRTYHRNKKTIFDMVKLLPPLLEKTIETKTKDYIKKFGTVGLDIPYVYKDDKYHTSVPFYLATPEYLSKLKFQKILTQQLEEKKSTIMKIKI